MSNLIGNAPNQVPTNADLGGLAYQDPDYAILGNVTVENTVNVVGNITAANVNTVNASISGNAQVTGNVIVTANVNVTGNTNVTANLNMISGNINMTTGNILLSSAYAPANPSPNVAVARGFVESMSIVFGM